MDKSKIPAWALDRKKMLILAIILLCTIAYSFRTVSHTKKMVDRIAFKATGTENFIDSLRPDPFGSAVDKAHDLIDGIGTEKLSGTYKNVNADESLGFKPDGTFTYGSGNMTEEGSWSLDENVLTLKLPGSNWQQSFLLTEHTKDKLTLLDTNYGIYYYYQK